MIKGLNDKIKVKELLIYDSEFELVDAKYEYDKAIYFEVLLLEKEYTENKSKELSTIPKREFIAHSKAHIKELRIQMDKVDKSIRREKIELRYLLRCFKIETTEREE